MLFFRLQRVGWLLGAAVLLAAAGCKTVEPPPALPPPPPPINMADYEDFDVGLYEDELPPRPTVEHDVPAALLDGKATVTQTPRTTQGYRIQIYSAQDKFQADDRMARATRWWRTQHSLGNLDDAYQDDASEPPVYLFYRQPYYRVRVGNFATRSDALHFLRMIERDFPDAFIVPDTVNLVR